MNDPKPETNCTGRIVSGYPLGQWDLKHPPIEQCRNKECKKREPKPRSRTQVYCNKCVDSGSGRKRFSGL